MSANLEKRTEQAAKGINLQTKPDERRRFLGSLRERAYLRMTVEQTTNLKLQNLFLSHMSDYLPYSILINGNMPQSAFISKVMTNCSKNNIPFTLVSDQTAQNNPDATGLLVVSSTAINQPRIEIKQVYSPLLPTDKLATPKKSQHGFWYNLFHKR